MRIPAAVNTHSGARVNTHSGVPELHGEPPPWVVIFQRPARASSAPALGPVRGVRVNENDANDFSGLAGGESSAQAALASPVPRTGTRRSIRTLPGPRKAGAGVALGVGYPTGLFRWA